MTFVALAAGGWWLVAGGRPHAVACQDFLHGHAPALCEFLILWAFSAAGAAGTTAFGVQVAPKEADNTQSEKPLACINPRRQDVPNHLQWAAGTLP
jgi:hypothetical protein